jgi:AAA family ATP:ADP antiporter
LWQHFRTDAGAASLAFATSLSIVGAWVAARAARDALFLSVFPIDMLPWMMLSAATLSLVSAAGISILLGRYGPARVVPVGFAISSALFLSEWLLMPIAPSLVPLALYLHLAVLGGVLISGFWSVLSERFDPYTGKTVLARTSAFGALGGVVGGLAAERVGALGGISPLLFGLFLAHAVCASGVVAIGAPPTARPVAGPDATKGSESGLAILRRTPLLRAMALMMVSIAGIEALLDFTLKAAAAEQFPDEAGLVRFFALFEMCVGVSAFLVQSALGGRFLHRFGLSWAMATRPALVALAAFGGVVLARFWTTVLVRAVDSVFMRSTFNAGFELLYTPLTPETKRPTKVYIDIVSSRVGDIAGASLVLVLLALLPALPGSLTLGLAAAASLGTLLLIRRVQHLYVAQLADNLKTGAIQLDPSGSLDALTSRTVFGSSTGSGQGDELFGGIILSAGF